MVCLCDTIYSNTRWQATPPSMETGGMTYWPLVLLVSHVINCVVFVLLFVIICYHMCHYLCHHLCYHIPYNLNISREKIFTDFKDFWITSKILTLKIFLALQFYAVFLQSAKYLEIFNTKCSSNESTKLLALEIFRLYGMSLFVSCYMSLLVSSCYITDAPGAMEMTWLQVKPEELMEPKVTVVI